MGYDGSLKFDTRIDESGFNSGITRLGSIAKTGLAVLAGAVAGCAVAVTKSSLDMVASMEQNIGGIETLFGTRGAKTVEEYAKLVGKNVDYVAAEFEMLQKAQATALDNANKAYETAGLSANEYMETVTSFAAALKQSAASELDAAEIANQTVIDMADNANKMGTNMELIQNAYQGFAKQNYTMLDNLKLGYGGTKTEMQRLLKDAEALTGIKYDIDNLADVYEAIHVIQTELGITGTTAQEAATTIEGSMKSAKASFDNFLAGSGTADELVSSVSNATEIIFKNIGEIVPRLVETVPAAAKGIAEGIASAFQNQGIADIGKNLLSEIVSGIEENVPTVITSGANILASFISGIGERLPELAPQALQLVVTLADAIISNIPTIVNAGISLLKGLAQGIVNSLPLLITEGPRIINDFADAIYSGLGQIILAGAQMLLSLLQGIWDNRGLLLENAGEIFMAFINVFSLSNMVSLGKNLLSSLGSGLQGMASNAVSTLKSIGERMLNAFTKGIYWSNGGVFTVNALTNGLNAAKTALVRALKAIGTNALTAFKSIDWRSVGVDVISGIARGITSSAGAIVSAAKNAAKKALDSAKSFLGIHSPSTVFRDQIGKNMALGMGEGFEKNVPVDAIEDSISGSVNKLKRASYSVTAKAPETTTSVINKTEVIYGDGPRTDDDSNTREIIIHTHVDLDGKEVGNSITKYVDQNMSDDEELRRRGN